MLLIGLLAAVILYCLVWVLPLAVANKMECSDLGGVYKGGTCFKVSGAYQLR